MKEEKVKSCEINVDKILEEVGVFGKYQLIYFILLLFPVIFTASHINNYIFSASNAKYRCKIPICDDSENEYKPEWLENTTPLDSKCLMYPMINSSIYRNINNSCPADWFDASETVHCDEYIYEKEFTFIQEIDIPCMEWKRTLIGTMHSIGTLIALPFIGFFSDRFGRKAVLIFSCAMEGLLGVIKSLSVNYEMFIAFELLEPAIGSGVYTASYILALELLIPQHRSLAATIIQLFFASGQLLMGVIAWSFQYWRTFLQVIYAPIMIFIIYKWLIDESVRWLLSKKMYRQVRINFEKMARINGKTLSDITNEQLQFNEHNESKLKNIDENEEHDKKSNYFQVLKSKILLVRLLKCAFRWITCIFCFFGLSINAVSLAGNVYLNFILSAVVELPAHLIAMLAMNYIGRKWTLVIAFIISGLSSLAYAFIPNLPELEWLSMTTYLISKLFITLAISCNYLYTSELFPTNLRHSMLAFCSMAGRIGSILAPQTPLLAIYMEQLPAILFGSTSLLSALLTITSPETLHRRLPETIEEAENMDSLIIMKNNKKIAENS